jgi:hypothetical protein
MLNIPIQTYKGAKDNKGTETTVNITIELIKGNKHLCNHIGKIRDYVNAIASLQEKANNEPENKLWADSLKDRKLEYDDLKKKLDGVTWSGTFAEAIAIKSEKIKDFTSGKITWAAIHESNSYITVTRRAEQLLQYSGLICIDIDKLPANKLKKLRDRLKLDHRVFILFTSPSGNGLKVIIKVAGGPAVHIDNFKAIENYFLHEYNLQIDPSGKDVSRLCFLSYDANCHTNSGCDIFDYRNYHYRNAVPAAVVSSLTKTEGKKLQSGENDLEWIKNFTDKKLTYTEGNRNNYIYLFACNCNRKGIDINDCFGYINSFTGDLTTVEVSATIKSAYDHNILEAGKYAKGQTLSRPVKNQAAKAGGSNSNGAVPPVNEPPIENSYSENEFVKFWWVTIDEKRTDEDGQPMKKYHVKYNKLIEFLEAGGYYRLLLMNNSYQFIKFKNNVCEPISIIHMKDFVFNFLRAGVKETGVLEMMRRGAKSYFIPQIMEGLEYKQIEFGKDTATEAFFYFRNCIAKVTKEGTTTLPYTQSQQAIWASSMIQRDFKPVDLKLPMHNQAMAEPATFDTCEMARYILLVSHSPNSHEEITETEASQRFLSICSSIGYMLHGYKSRVAKAIIAVDHKIPEDKSEQNGGTGKSIVGESFKYLKSTTIIDGREFKEDYPFKFEMIGVDTKVVVMQDCRYNLDFGSFFVPITNDLTYNRRHTGYITIPFADAPKWWFDTNFVFKGEGASFRRRMHVIEFDDYFSENHNPYDEFGHFLFIDWDDNQWNQFYNFYLYCVQLYLQNGLIDYPKSNYESRKMMAESPSEFIDFLDATDEQGTFKTKRNDWFQKKDLLKRWNDEAKELGLQPCAAHMLTKWMKKYCHARPFRLMKDKTNGIEWWLLADGTYKGTGKRSEKVDTPTQQLF